MKLTHGIGSPKTGGCWMAVVDFYNRGSLDWTDQPECVDPMIRHLCISLNDWCKDGEREELIGPFLWAPIGTRDDKLVPERLKIVVQFAMDCAADALDAASIQHDLRQVWGDRYGDAKAAVVAAGAVAYDAHYAWATIKAVGVSASAADVANAAINSNALATAIYTVNVAQIGVYKEGLIDLILKLCSVGTPIEVNCAVSKREALRVVCKVP